MKRSKRKCESEARTRAKNQPKIPLGRSLVDGRLKLVSEVPRGLACKCICPFCEAALKASRCTPPRRSYFSHHGETDCKAPPSEAERRETLLHMRAKEVLLQHKWVRTPAVKAVYMDLREDVREAASIELDVVVQEPTMPRYEPDILAEEKGKQLIIEVAVTHKCEPKKIDDIRNDRIDAFEIDLDGIEYDAPWAVVESAVLETADRYWIFNELQEAAVARLQAQFEARALARDAERLVALWREPPHPARSRNAQLDGLVDAARLMSLIRGETPPGTCFNVAPCVWQATILERMVPALNGGPLLRRNVSEFFALMRDWRYVKDAFQDELSEALVAAVKRIEPAFRMPSDTIEDYLDWLKSSGVVRTQGTSWWVVEEAVAKIQNEEDRRRREATIRKVVDHLVVSSGTSHSFDFGQWLATCHEGLSTTPAASIRDGLRFGDLQKKLFALSDMLETDGQPVDHLLDLPLERIRARRKQEELVRAELAERRRVAALSPLQRILERVRGLLKSR